MKTLIYAFILLVFIPFSLFADDIKDVEALLQSKLNAVMLVLQDETLSIDSKKSALIETAESMIDFKLMAKLSLGKNVWTGLEKEKKEKFTELFVKMIKNSYVEKLKLYNNEKIVYKEAIQKKKNKIYIPTNILSKEKTFTMLYKFYKSRHGWKIYDIEIQDVSIISSYRSQTKHILSNGTIDDLILALEKPDDK